MQLRIYVVLNPKLRLTFDNKQNDPDKLYNPIHR